MSRLERVGFGIGLRIGRVLRAVHFQRTPLQVVPKLGPWLMVYGHESPVCCSGVMVSGGSNEITVSGARKGHRGAILGLRWRSPRDGDRSFTWQYPPKHPGTDGP